MPVLATDDFTNTNGTVLTTHSANWTKMTGGILDSVLDIQDNAVAWDSGPDGWSGYYRNDATFNPKQYAQGKIAKFTATGSAYQGLVVRASGNNGYFYIVTEDWDFGYIYRFSSGTATYLGEGSYVALNDIIRLEAVGSTITAFINGVKDFFVVDSTHATGACGVGFAGDTSNPRPDCQLDDWEGGNLYGWQLDAKTLGTYQSTDPNTVNHQCAANAKLLVVALFVTGTTARTGSSPTYNGIPLSTVTGFYYTAPGECGSELWYLFNPPKGDSYTVSVPNTNNVTFNISVSSFIPLKGDTKYDDDNTDQGTSGTASLGVWHTSDYPLIVGVVASDHSSVPSPGSDVTGLHTYDAGAHTFGSAYIVSENPGNNTSYISWSLGAVEDFSVQALAVFDMKQQYFIPII